MAERIQVEKQSRKEAVKDVDVTEVAERAADTAEAIAAADALLDEIDSILEDSELALNYVQQNGE